MSYVTTLIAAGNDKLNQPLILQAKTHLNSHHTTWLEENRALDLFHDHLPATPLAFPSCDTVTQPTSHRRKRILVSDMDSTLIHQECIDELADMAGIKSHVAAITERAMNGELDFKDALRERVALLKDLPESTLQEVYEKRITLMQGAATLVATMKHHAGAYGLLVSGGFTFFTSRVADALGFDEDQSNTLMIDHGVLSGEVADPILDKDAKREALTACCAAQGVKLTESLAVGDGANDLPMLLEAGLGVAYHAKPVVQAQARAAINHNDLSALLFVQGYARDEWMA